MRRQVQNLGILIGLLLTSTWPILLCGAVGGQRGVQAGLMAYLAVGGVLFLVLLFGGIRGILDG
jgi:hypothetical protein